MSIPLRYPLFRLHGGGSWATDDGEGDHRYWVDVVLEDGPDTEADGYDHEDTWTHMPKTKELGATTTREAAMAILRLHEAKEYQDWTPAGPRKGWDSPPP